MANSWYAYDGVGDPFIPASYQRVTINAACLDGANPCAIYILGGVTDVPANPFSDNILNYLANGLATLQRQPLTGKAFVYLKG